MRMGKFEILGFTSLLAITLAGCMAVIPDTAVTPGAPEEPAPTGDAYEGAVMELAIRRVHTEQDMEDFQMARTAFIEQLRAQDGVSADQEYVAIVDFSTFAPPEPAVLIGMTQYEDLNAFMAASETLSDAEVTRAFLATFSPEVFTALRPLDGAARYELTTIASEPGQVLEIAVRNLAEVDGFVADDYVAKRDAFLQGLSQQAGVVAEYQWISVIDANLVVGMTVYEDVEAFQRIATSEFVQSAAYTNFLSAYPPQWGYASLVAED